MAARTISYPVFVNPVPAFAALLFLLIGGLSAFLFVPTLERPSTAHCEHAATGVMLQCSLGAAPARPLVELPKVASRRAGRNTYNDAALRFADHSVRTANIEVGRTAAVNRAIAEAAAGGPAVDLPLETGRWIGLLMAMVPVGLVVLLIWWQQPRSYVLFVEDGVAGTRRITTRSVGGEVLCGPLVVAPGARIHVVRGQRVARVYVDDTPLLPRATTDEAAHDRVAAQLQALLG